MKETVIIGYFGKGNIGDEAILSSTLSRMKRDENVIVLSENPDETERMHYVRSEKYTFRHLPLLLLKIALKRPNILFPGGGYFYGNAVRSIALISIVSKIFGSKVSIVAVGVGPYLSHDIVGLYNDNDKFSGLNKFCLRLIFTIADYASVRDNFSKKMVVLAGGHDVKIENDPALSLESVDARFAFDLFNSALPKLNGPIIGLNLRYIPDDKLMNKIINVVAEVCKFVIEKLNGNIIFVPFGVRYQNELNGFNPINDDEVAYNKFKKRYNPERIYFLRERYTPSELLGMFRYFDAFIGMRLHSVVFSYTMKVPVFAISYEHKINSFVEDKDIPYARIDSIGSENIIDFLRSVFKSE